MEGRRIVGLCILAAVSYGIAHDQVTARVCVEYFTIGHPPLFTTESPTLLGIGWGIAATWWVGLLLGVPLALVATRGGRPVRTARSLVRPIGLLLLAMAMVALAAGVAGYLLAERGLVVLLEPMASRIPESKHSAFLADLWAHIASYASGFLGGAVLILRVRRWRQSASETPQTSPFA